MLFHTVLKLIRPNADKSMVLSGSEEEEKNEKVGANCYCYVTYLFIHTKAV